jgi:hypothetical protein
MIRHREEVVNIYLASCLEDAGIHADPEQIEHIKGGRTMPDVIVSFMGLRCIIEGKFDDTTGAQQMIEQKISERVRDGITHIALGIVYPISLRSEPIKSLSSAIQSAQFQFTLALETNYDHPEWRAGDLDAIRGVLRLGHETLLADELLMQSVERIRAGMEGLVRLLTNYPASGYRVAKVIGIDPDAKLEREDTDE